MERAGLGSAPLIFKESRVFISEVLYHGRHAMRRNGGARISFSRAMDAPSNGIDGFESKPSTA